MVVLLKKNAINPYRTALLWFYEKYLELVLDTFFGRYKW